MKPHPSMETYLTALDAYVDARITLDRRVRDRETAAPSMEEEHRVLLRHARRRADELRVELSRAMARWLRETAPVD